MTILAATGAREEKSSLVEALACGSADALAAEGEPRDDDELLCSAAAPVEALT